MHKIEQIKLNLINVCLFVFGCFCLYSVFLWGVVCGVIDDKIINLKLKVFFNFFNLSLVFAH